MLKLRSGKVLQRPQQKMKSQEITGTKAFKVSTAPKTRRPEAIAKTKALVTKKKSKISKLLTKQVFRSKKNNGNPTTCEEKLLQLLYTKGPTAFGSVKKFTNKHKIETASKRTKILTQNIKGFGKILHVWKLLHMTLMKFGPLTWHKWTNFQHKTELLSTYWLLLSVFHSIYVSFTSIWKKNGHTHISLSWKILYKQCTQASNV